MKKPVLNLTNVVLASGSSGTCFSRLFRICAANQNKHDVGIRNVRRTIAGFAG
jgi:hypothetical protein